MSDNDPGEKNRPPSETLRSVAGLAIMEAAGDSAVPRRRGHSSSDEPSPVALRRTVPGEDGATASGGLGNGGVNAVVIRKTRRRKKKSTFEIVSRMEWLACPPTRQELLGHPLPYVIISHTAGMSCMDKFYGCKEVHRIQRYHMEQRGWPDIGYNFLVGGDGRVYQGRDWDVVGNHSRGFNGVSIGISFIGNFVDFAPSRAQVESCKRLIQLGVTLGKISPKYKLLGHRQVSPTESPGKMAWELIQRWDHWSPVV